MYSSNVINCLLPASHAAAECQVKQKKASLSISTTTTVYVKYIKQYHYVDMIFVHVVTYNCNVALWSFGTHTECLHPT